MRIEIKVFFTKQVALLLTLLFLSSTALAENFSTDNLSEREFLNELLQLEQQIAMEIIAENTGLLFFFRSDCPFCHRFAPTLKQFSLRYGIDVEAISLDGGTLPDYPEPKIDNGQAKALSVSAVPAVFAITPATQTIVPIAYGLVRPGVLSQRLIKQFILSEERLALDQSEGSTPLKEMT